MCIPYTQFHKRKFNFFNEYRFRVSFVKLVMIIINVNSTKKVLKNLHNQLY